MVIAILISLGVTATGILLLLIALTIFKRIKTIRHPAVFKTRVRLAEGEFPGLTNSWKKVYGGWVTSVFTTRKGPALNIADVVPVAKLDILRNAAIEDEVSGLGETPMIALFTLTTEAKIDIAMSAEEQPTGLGPFQAQAEQLGRSPA